MLKQDSLRYIFVRDSMGLSSTTLTYPPPKATKCNRITQNNGHCAVQGHLRSPIIVSIESPHATSY